MAQNLKTIRASIASLKTEIAQVKDSLRPVEELTSQLRAYIESLAAPYQRFISIAGSVISRGTPLNELVNNLPPSLLPAHTLGLVINASGVDTIVERAVELAKADETGAMRLSVAERDDRLAELRRELYALELIEETMLDGAERRPDANSACVLQVPLAAALEIDERNGNNHLLSGKW
ncbi:MAG: hypothetical protein HGA71_15560 [Azonexaceae bacterium]|nr:hypothetical protein [Azonexaceae bacterium]